MATEEQLAPESGTTAQSRENARAKAAGETARLSSGDSSIKRDATVRRNVITSESLRQEEPLDVRREPASTAVEGELGRLKSSSDSSFEQQLARREQVTGEAADQSSEDLIKAMFDAPTRSGLEDKAFSTAGGVDNIQVELDKADKDLRDEQEALRVQVERIEKNLRGKESTGVEFELNKARTDSLRRQTGLAVIQQSIQGRFDSAKAIADRAVNAQLEQSQRELDIRKIIVDKNEARFTTAENRLFQSQFAADQRKIDKEAEDSTNINNIGLTVGQNGGGAQLMEQIFNAKTPEEAAALGANFLSNPLDRQLKNLKIQQAESDLKALDTLNQVLNDQKWGSIINGTASLVGSERGKELRKNMANNIANGNYKSAWADVTNAVEEKLTGENATKFGQTVTGYEVMKGLQNAIQTYDDGGGDLGLLKGTAEQISNKLLGVTTNPELTALATQLEREFQAYRTAATGAAFSPEESRDYAKVNPRTTANLDLNMAIIDGALNTMENKILGTVKPRVPGAEDLWKINTGQTTSDYLNSVDESLSDSSDIFSNYLNSVLNPTNQ